MASNSRCLMDKLIVVNRQDQVLGRKSKEACHTLKGILHRGFSVFVINKRGQVLLQKRSQKKKLWPGFWSNTCCSHPKPGETYLQAGKRRLKEELGFTCPLKFLLKFQYRAVYQDLGSENEICAVLLGEDDGRVRPNLEEVTAVRWLDFNQLKRELKAKPKVFTPWLRKELSLFPPQGK